MIGRSLRWSFGLAGAGAILQFLLAAVLARFLAPTDYGLVAAATAGMRLLQYLSDLGIAQTATQKPDFDRGRDAPVLFTIALLVNAALVAAVWLLAPSLGGGDPHVTAILRVMASCMLLNAAAQTGLGLLRRDLDFRTIGLINLAAMVLGQGLVALPLAWAGFGPWSLVAGTLTQSGVIAALVLARVRHPVRPAGFTASRLRALASRAWGFSLLRILDSAGLHTLPIIVLLLAGTGAAGLWDRALVLTLIPLEMLYGTLGQVLFPAFSRLDGDRDRLRRSWLSVLLLLPFLVACIAAGMAAAAGPLVAVALGPAWAPAAGPVFWLALWAALRSVGHICGTLLEGGGRLGTRGVIQTGYLLVLAALLAIVRPEGAAQTARILVFADTLLLVPLVMAAAHACGARWRDAFARLGLAFLPAPLVGLAIHVTVDLLAPAPALLTLLAAIATGAVALALCVAFHPSRELRRLIVNRALGDTLAFDRGRHGLTGRLMRFLER
ncbi:oligosaccharide flippase family protein [Niveispirillum sp. KHB5.9]|uniref:oligosaccharide flippase family protein n=1 Tax=Niveispirillum sp. KHB5.9 TaxID=3400269 RepID=UPI003A852974